MCFLKLEVNSARFVNDVAKKRAWASRIGGLFQRV